MRTAKVKLMTFQKVVERKADVSVELLKLGTKHCLALIRVLLFLAAKPVSKRTRLGIEFGFDHVESDLGFLVTSTLHSLFGAIEEQDHVSHHPNGLPKRAALVIILSSVLSQIVITDHGGDLQGDLVTFSH